jgi:hypothetical protein
MDKEQSSTQREGPMLETGSMVRDIGRECSFVQVVKHMKEDGRTDKRNGESVQILEFRGFMDSKVLNSRTSYTTLDLLKVLQHK